MVMMICDKLPVRPGKLFVLMQNLSVAYVVAPMSSAKIYYDWYHFVPFKRPRDIQDPMMFSGDSRSDNGLPRIS